MKHIKLFLCFFSALLVLSCTKLEENFRSQLEESNSATINAGQLLISAYSSLNTFQNGNIWHVNQHTTDETMAPTRGPDWDDNGQWRALHAHTWNADQGNIRNAFNELLSAQFAASNVLQFNPSPQQAAEARFIRALSMFMVLDGWGQVPYRENLTDYRITPKTLKGTEVTDFIISELNAIIATLPDNSEAYVANKNAARALLMKAYLNKGMYVNRITPTFDAADMAKVISLADEIIASNKYSLDDNFFDNFAPDNNVKSSENIYTLYNQNGDRGGGVANSAIQGFHYNMSPRGNNGFSTLSDFYDKFEATDQRRGIYYNYAAALPNPGKRINVGFLEGQQYNLTTDAPLQDRKGNPLIFFREVKIRETDPNMLERSGIRVVKYPYDYLHLNQQSDNDWAIFRYADVLLMKAEAQLRSGNTTGPLAIVNQVRLKRGATPMVSVDLAKLLDERGREMYWEGWRRQDLIRYGKFLQPWQEKPADDQKNLLFPVPSSQLAVNPNLTQNPGY